jgi:hypothetical protein
LIISIAFWIAASAIVFSPSLLDLRRLSLPPTHAD